MWRTYDLTRCHLIGNKGNYIPLEKNHYKTSNSSWWDQETVQIKVLLIENLIIPATVLQRDDYFTSKIKMGFAMVK